MTPDRGLHNILDELRVPDIDNRLFDAGFFFADFAAPMTATSRVSSVLEHMGITTEHMFTGEYVSRIHPDDRDHYSHLVDRFHKGVDDELYCEYRIMDAYDGWQWILTQAIVIQRFEDGTVWKLFGVDRNISVQKKAERMLTTLFVHTSQRENLVKAIDDIANRPNFDERIFEPLRQIVTFDCAELWWYRKRQPQLLMSSPSTSDSHPMRPSDAHMDSLRFTRHPTIVDRPDDADNHLAVSRLMIPLRVQNELLGAVILYKNAPRHYRNVDLTPIGIISTFLAIELKQILVSRKNMELEVDVRQQEQLKLSRELHDGVAQNLAYCKLILERAIGSPSQSSAGNPDLERLREIIQTTMREVRSISEDLRFSTLGYDPAAVLQDHIRRFREVYGIKIDFAADLPSSTRAGTLLLENLVRIAQELTSNAARHSNSDRVALRCWRRGKMLHLTVSDEGTGMTDSVPGLGMTGVVERCELLGGTVQWTQPNSGHGTEVLVSLPIGAATEVAK